jgi:ABC-type transport system substrate-binding protein
VLTGSILTNVCETLLIRDPRTMELEPLLATSWRNVNPTTWEFKRGYYAFVVLTVFAD